MIVTAMTAVINRCIVNGGHSIHPLVPLLPLHVCALHARRDVALLVYMLGTGTNFGGSCFCPLHHTHSLVCMFSPCLRASANQQAVCTIDS